MPSGKATRRKRAAEAQRPKRPVRRDARTADRRLWVLGGVVAALVVALVVGTVVATSGSDGSADADTAEGTTLVDATEAVAVFEGIPQQSLALGEPDAPVTMLEFADLQCPFCREFAVETLPELVEKHVRTGNLRIELRGLAFIGADSERGLRAAYAASRQNRLFEFSELLYYNQGAENSGWLSQDLVEAAGRSLPGLDVARLVSDMDSDAVSDLIDDHAAEAEQRDVNSTPSVFVGPTGGDLELVTMTSVTDLEAIERAITAAAG
jgi:protein-disulfide isomerase